MNNCHAGLPNGRGPPTRQKAEGGGGGVDCHTMHAYTSNCTALSCASFVNSMCALTDFSCPVSDRKLFKLMAVCVIGSIRSASILVFKVIIKTIYIHKCKQHACVEKGFRPVRRRALGLCGEGRLARAHVKSSTFHSRSQCISTERKQRHLCSEFSSA